MPGIGTAGLDHEQGVRVGGQDELEEGPIDEVGAVRLVAR
jgi:hypothetical protein